MKFTSIDTYLPREGPETKIPIGLLVSKRLEVQLPICLERGRKPKNVINVVVPCDRCIDPYYLERGRKKEQQQRSKRSQMYIYLSTSRGAGNRQRSKFLFNRSFVQPSIYLARGRKLCWLYLRKFCSQYSYQSTSRGAGNGGLKFFNFELIQCIATYLPREGPETF